MAALNAAEHFRHGNYNNNDGSKSKKGTANIAVGLGKDDGGDKSGDEATKKAEESSDRELTEDMTFGELLRLTGIVNITIGMSEVDGEIYEEDGSWDGDVLANVSVGFCQVQAEKPG